MEIDSIMGIIVIVAAIAALLVLSWWSRRFIDRINDAGPGTLRQILSIPAADRRHE